MNTDQALRGNWKQIKGMVKERWDQLTDTDLKSFDGSVDDLVGLIQEKTGATKSEISRALDEIVGAGSSMVNRAASSVRDAVERAASNVSEGYAEISDRMHAGQERAERLVRRHPTESVVLALGTGLIAGIIVGLVLRAR